MLYILYVHSVLLQPHIRRFCLPPFPYTYILFSSPVHIHIYCIFYMYIPFSSPVHINIYILYLTPIFCSLQPPRCRVYTQAPVTCPRRWLRPCTYIYILYLTPIFCSLQPCTSIYILYLTPIFYSFRPPQCRVYTQARVTCPRRWCWPCTHIYIYILYYI